LENKRIKFTAAHQKPERIIMKNEDIRWTQRFSNYKKGLSQLKSAADLASQRTLSDLEHRGMIQSLF